jgi:hypothetical protein
MTKQTLQAKAGAEWWGSPELQRTYPTPSSIGGSDTSVSIARTVAPMSDSFMMHVRFLSPGEGRPSIDGIRQGKLCDTAFGETISDGSSPASRPPRDALSADRGHGPFVAESGRFGRAPE